MPPINVPTPAHSGDIPVQWQEDYFVYGPNPNPVVINAGNTAEATMQIQADSKFLWERAAYYATIADAAFTKDTRPIPNVAVQIIDSGSGRQLFSVPQPIPSVFGTGELPYVLSQPRYFLPNSLIQIQFTNFDAAASYSIRLAFIGTKIFTFGPTGPGVMR